MNALERFRSLLGVGNVLPEGEAREAYAEGLKLACTKADRESVEFWRERAYAQAAEIARLRTALEERLTADLPDALDRQAGQIVRKLGAWCEEQKPGRGFRAVVLADGTWRASLIECERRTASGADLADALGQIAQVASVELIG